MKTALRDFRRGIKQDVTQFSALKDEAQWDNWHRTTLAQAHAQGVADVLNPLYSPTNPEEKELFKEKQVFMYAVFKQTLKTDKGRALVRHYEDGFDAQSIFKDLKAYQEDSTKANIDSSDLLTYITTAKLGDGSWKGTTHGFILHWRDQVRKYHALDKSFRFPQCLQKTMLENAVHGIDELRAIKTQALQLEASCGKPISFAS